MNKNKAWINHFDFWCQVNYLKTTNSLF